MALVSACCADSAEGALSPLLLDADRPRPAARVPLRDDALGPVPLRAELLRDEPLREEPLSPDDAERPRALEPDEDRPLVDPEPDRLRLPLEEDPLAPDPLLPEPEDDRPLAARDCRVPLLALRVLPLPLPLRELPLELRARLALLRELDEPPLRDERDCVLG